MFKPGDVLQSKHTKNKVIYSGPGQHSDTFAGTEKPSRHKPERFCVTHDNWARRAFRKTN